MFRSIVVGTDGSETAARAVREASELARRDGARLHVVSAGGGASGLQLAGAAGLAEAGAWPGEPSIDTGAVLDDCARLLSGEVRVETHTRPGDAADAILGVAREADADLIVVGSRGMHGKRRYLLGSVPNKVSHQAGCSVLIVHTG